MNKTRLKSRNKQKDGFTIFELMVVSILMVVTMLISVQFWVWFSPGIKEIIAREHILGEARIAMQSLAYDFGSARHISVGENSIGIDKDGSGSDIFYSKGNDDNPNVLQRRSLSEGTEFTVADRVSKFTAEQDANSADLYKITLEFGYHGAARKIVFWWREPAI